MRTGTATTGTRTGTGGGGATEGRTAAGSRKARGVRAPRARRRPRRRTSWSRRRTRSRTCLRRRSTTSWSLSRASRLNSPNTVHNAINRSTSFRRSATLARPSSSSSRSGSASRSRSRRKTRARGASSDPRNARISTPILPALLISPPLQAPWISRTGCCTCRVLLLSIWPLGNALYPCPHHTHNHSFPIFPTSFIVILGLVFNLCSPFLAFPPSHAAHFARPVLISCLVYIMQTSNLELNA